MKAGLGSQDWDARAAQEVAAARARGAQLGALVDRKQHRAEFLRMKAARAEAAASSKPNDSGLVEAAAAAKAEVPARHLPAFSGMAPVLSCSSYQEKQHTSMVLLSGREDVSAARGSRLAVAAGLDDSGQLSAHCSYPVSSGFVLHGR